MRGDRPWPRSRRLAAAERPQYEPPAMNTLTVGASACGTEPILTVSRGRLAVCRTWTMKGEEGAAGGDADDGRLGRDLVCRGRRWGKRAPQVERDGASGRRPRAGRALLGRLIKEQATCIAGSRDHGRGAMTMQRRWPRAPAGADDMGQQSVSLCPRAVGVVRTSYASLTDGLGETGRAEDGRLDERGRAAFAVRVSPCRSKVNIQPWRRWWVRSLSDPLACWQSHGLTAATRWLAPVSILDPAPAS